MGLGTHPRTRRLAVWSSGESREEQRLSRRVRQRGVASSPYLVGKPVLESRRWKDDLAVPGSSRLGKGWAIWLHQISQPILSHRADGTESWFSCASRRREMIFKACGTRGYCDPSPTSLQALREPSIVTQKPATDAGWPRVCEWACVSCRAAYPTPLP